MRLDSATSRPPHDLSTLPFSRKPSVKEIIIYLSRPRYVISQNQTRGHLPTDSPYDFRFSANSTPKPGLKHHQRVAVDPVVRFHREEGSLVASHRDGLLSISRRGCRRFCVGAATWKVIFYFTCEWQIRDSSCCTGSFCSSDRAWQLSQRWLERPFPEAFCYDSKWS